MVAVTVTSRAGDTRTLEGETGRKLMEVIRDAGVEEMIGLCGGFANCGTCHCYVDESWFARTGKGADPEGEEVMLEGLIEARRNSRLACQIILDESLDGIAVIMAPEE